MLNLILKNLKKSGDKRTLIKIDKLLNELREHPTKGTGKPEQLKYYDTPTWSRRINDKHRLIYRIQEDKITVFLFSFCGYYGNK